jgi:hypothetical protein
MPGNVDLAIGPMVDRTQLTNQHGSRAIEPGLVTSLVTVFSTAIVPARKVLKVCLPFSGGVEVQPELEKLVPLMADTDHALAVARSVRQMVGIGHDLAMARSV